MLRRWSIGLIVAALAALAMAPAALAGPKGTDRPFKATMSGYAHWNVTAHCGEGPTTLTESPGNATHMGKIMSYWSHCPAEDRADDGFIKLVDARGFELHGYYDYGEEIDNADGSYTFRKLLVWDGGTGPYADAQGWAAVTYGVTPVFVEGCEFDWDDMDSVFACMDFTAYWPWWGTLEGRINM